MTHTRGRIEDARRDNSDRHVTALTDELVVCRRTAAK